VPGFGRVVSAAAAAAAVLMLVLVLVLVLVLLAQLGGLEGWAQPSLLIAADTQPIQNEAVSIRCGRGQA